MDSVRHTCAALLIAQGAHPRAIMERLGHSNITVTLARRKVSPLELFTHGDRTYEFVTISPSGTSDWIVECTEMSNPDGFFGEIVVPLAPGAPYARLDGQIPLPVLLHWLTLLPDPITADADRD